LTASTYTISAKLAKFAAHFVHTGGALDRDETAHVLAAIERWRRAQK
jgi:hypothetical protein